VTAGNLCPILSTVAAKINPTKHHFMFAHKFLVIAYSQTSCKQRSIREPFWWALQSWTNKTPQRCLPCGSLHLQIHPVFASVVDYVLQQIHRGLYDCKTNRMQQHTISDLEIFQQEWLLTIISASTMSVVTSNDTNRVVRDVCKIDCCF